MITNGGFRLVTRAAWTLGTLLPVGCETVIRAVKALRLIDGRWGHNCKRGNCPETSVEVVVYYRGSGTTIDDARGSTHVQIFDIIANHGNPNPRPAWLDLTEATRRNDTVGRWKYPR